MVVIARWQYRGDRKGLMNGSVTISKHAQAFPDVMKVMLSSRQVVEIVICGVLPIILFGGSHA